MADISYTIMVWCLLPGGNVAEVLYMYTDLVRSRAESYGRSWADRYPDDIVMLLEE